MWGYLLFQTSRTGEVTLPIELGRQTKLHFVSNRTDNWVYPYFQMRLTGEITLPFYPSFQNGSTGKAILPFEWVWMVEVTLPFEWDLQESLPFFSNGVDEQTYPSFSTRFRWMKLPFLPFEQGGWVILPILFRCLTRRCWPSFRRGLTSEATLPFEWAACASLPFLSNGIDMRSYPSFQTILPLERVQTGKVTMSSFWTKRSGCVTFPFERAGRSMLTFISNGVDKWDYPSFQMGRTGNVNLPFERAGWARLTFF